MTGFMSSLSDALLLRKMSSDIARQWPLGIELKSARNDILSSCHISRLAASIIAILGPARLLQARQCLR